MLAPGTRVIMVEVDHRGVAHRVNCIGTVVQTGLSESVSGSKAWYKVRWDAVTGLGTGWIHITQLEPLYHG